jgi:ribA/ribD-fused uncharacterized protein
MTATTTDNPIRAFTGRYGFLSNFSACSKPVFLDDDDPVVPYATTEHAYQAAKTLSPVEREHIRGLATAGASKRAGRNVQMRPDWDAVKDDVMLHLLRQKFHPSRPEGQALRMTGTRHLEEGNRHGDRYWGTVDGEGRNVLGVLLMQVREEFYGEETR